MVVSDAAVEAAAGALGSVASLLITYPLKTIYTLQALNSSKPSLSNAGSAGPDNSILGIVMQYKLKGLYVGVGPNVLETGLSSATFFFLYSKLRKIMLARAAEATEKAEKLAAASRGSSSAEPSAQSSPDSLKAASASASPKSKKSQALGVGASLIVASLAGIGNQLVTMPVSLVATRMTSSQRVLPDGSVTPVDSPWTIITSILHDGGPLAFWKGLLPSMVLISNPAIQFMLFEQLLTLMRARKAKNHQRGNVAAARLAAAVRGDDATADETAAAQEAAAVVLSPGEVFLASALAKVGATIATYPLIVVKSRLQAGSKSGDPRLRYTSAFDAVLRIWEHEGLGGFFGGIQAKIFQTAIGAGLTLMLKEVAGSSARALLAPTPASGTGSKSSAAKHGFFSPSTIILFQLIMQQHHSKVL